MVAAPADAPFADGPVVVLGGSPERLETARPMAVADDGAVDRELVLSASAADEWEADGRSCDEPLVHCVMPDPPTTWGEAQTTAALARERGWSNATVVTSDWHVARARLVFRRCIDAEIAVVAAPTDHDPPYATYLAVREGLEYAASFVLYRGC